ncbi:MAG: Chromosomal replication initiator protein DnaA [Bacteroidota bacterium]|jgi:chromosomal replication initiation ATPase DnaA
MNTNSENQNVTIHRLKKDLNYWKTIAARYSRKNEEVDELKCCIEAMHRDIDFLKTMLGEKLAKPSVQELIEQSIGEVYSYFLPTMIQSRSRKSEVVNLRQIWMKLMYQYAGQSLVQIAKIANRDHSTVLYACRKVDDLCFVEKEYSRKFYQINAILVKKLK